MKHVQERALLIEAMLVEFFICLGVMIWMGLQKKLISDKFLSHSFKLQLFIEAL